MNQEKAKEMGFIYLAKTCQYGGLTILGVEGYKQLKNKFKCNKQQA